MRRASPRHRPQALRPSREVRVRLRPVPGRILTAARRREQIHSIPPPRPLCSPLLPGGRPANSPSSNSVTDRELAIVRAGYELWNAGDIAGLAERYFHPDIEYHNSPEWPGQRVYRGSEAVARFLKEEVADVIGLEPVEIQRIEVIGEEIVIALQAPTRVAQSDLDFGIGPVFHVARVRDDRVVRVRVYLDESQALDA